MYLVILGVAPTCSLRNERIQVNGIYKYIYIYRDLDPIIERVLITFKYHYFITLEMKYIHSSFTSKPQKTILIPRPPPLSIYQL